MFAMARVVAAKGFAATTVSDIVSEAGTSKRTFYEHFSDKQDCYLEAFDACTDLVVIAINAALTDGAHPAQRYEEGIRAYLEAMAAFPEMTQAFFVQLPSAGREAQVRRANMIERMADDYLAWKDDGRKAYPDFPQLTHMQSLAIVAALSEIVHMKALRDGPERVIELGDELVAMGQSLIYGAADKR